MLDAAKRELLEELGVEVRRVTDSVFSVADPGSLFVIEFVPAEIAGTPRCLEHETIRWTSLEELLSLPLAPSDRRFAEFLRSNAPLAPSRHD
jgi:8-oxo-dGTP pyrophosphatase MutT (NUDIX family)